MKPINEFNIKKKIESIRQKALSKVFVHPQSVLYPIFLLAANLWFKWRVICQKKQRLKGKVMIIFLLFTSNMYQPNSVTDACMCLCDRDKLSVCMCMWLFCMYKVDYVDHNVDELDTRVWGCWIYMVLSDKRTEDLWTLPGTLRISQCDAHSHHPLSGWSIVVWKWGLQPLADRCVRCPSDDILWLLLSIYWHTYLLIWERNTDPDIQHLFFPSVI